MMQARERGRRQTVYWIHLGACGVLQPLSSEFLYRSPHDSCAHACRWRRLPLQGNDRAAH